MAYIKTRRWVLILLICFTLPAFSQERGNREIGVEAAFIIDDEMSHRGLGANYKLFLADWMYLSGNTGMWFMRNVKGEKVIPLTVGVGASFDDFFQYYFSAGTYATVGNSKAHVGFGINPGIRLRLYLDDHFIFSSKVSYHGIWVDGSKLEYLEMGVGLSYVMDW